MLFICKHQAFDYLLECQEYKLASWGQGSLPKSPSMDDGSWPPSAARACPEKAYVGNISWAADWGAKGALKPILGNFVHPSGMRWDEEDTACGKTGHSPGKVNYPSAEARVKSYSQPCVLQPYVQMVHCKYTFLLLPYFLYVSCKGWEHLCSRGLLNSCQNESLHQNT